MKSSHLITPLIVFPWVAAIAAPPETHDTTIHHLEDRRVIVETTTTITLLNSPESIRGRHDGDASELRDLDAIAFTTAHEIGHILLGGGHPDEGGGIAPLESLTLDLHKIRLMCSGPNRVVGSSRMLVKTEWEEVKSGNRTFSFKGQAEEYRFLPDGTWETIPIENPPDDDPRNHMDAPVQPDAEAAQPEDNA